jgi:hypothetical protein
MQKNKLTGKKNTLEGSELILEDFDGSFRDSCYARNL